MAIFISVFKVVGQWPFLFLYLKLWATGPKFNNGCGGPVPHDMLQWATWPYKVVCCGPLGRGGGDVCCVCIQHACIQAYAPDCVWGNDSRRICSSGNVCLFRTTRNARITHRYNTTLYGVHAL